MSATGRSGNFSYRAHSPVLSFEQQLSQFIGHGVPAAIEAAYQSWADSQPVFNAEDREKVRAMRAALLAYGFIVEA